MREKFDPTTLYHIMKLNFYKPCVRETLFLFFNETYIKKCSDKPLITREVSDTNTMFPQTLSV